MKPKQKQQKLEQLVEEQEIVADQEVLAEQEAQPTPEPVTLEYSATIGYREHEDVKDLTDLVYGRWLLKDSIRGDEICSKADKHFWKIMAAGGGYLGGGGALTFFFPVLDIYQIIMGGLAVVAASGTGFFAGSKRDKKIQQGWTEKIGEKQSKITELEQKLSAYETNYNPADLVLAKTEGSSFDRNISVLYGHSVNSSVDVISVLQPRDYVTPEQMKAVENGAVLAFYSKDDTLVNDGFLRHISDDSISLFQNNTVAKKGTYTYDELEKGEITVRVLTPVMKQRIVQGYRVKG